MPFQRLPCPSPISAPAAPAGPLTAPGGLLRSLPTLFRVATCSIQSFPSQTFFRPLLCPLLLFRSGSESAFIHLTCQIWKTEKNEEFKWKKRHFHVLPNSRRDRCEQAVIGGTQRVRVEHAPSTCGFPLALVLGIPVSLMVWNHTSQTTWAEKPVLAFEILSCCQMTWWQSRLGVTS